MAIGCYIPKYLPASYKGVPFRALDVASEHGRRGAEGEFPFGENTAYADLGRRIRTFPVSGRLEENSHIADAAALIAAAESPGPGILVHPSRGILTVACRSLRVKDNPVESQGITEIEFDFVEANDWTNGFNLGSTLSVGLSLANLILVLSDSFDTKYRPREVPFYQVNASVEPASSAISVIRQEFAQATGLDRDTQIWAALSDLNRAASDITLLQDNAETFETIKLGMLALSQFTEGTAQFNAFKRVANNSSRVPNILAPGSLTQEAVFSYVRTLAAGYMARGALEQQAGTLAQALTQYEQVTNILLDEIDAARASCDNPLFLELRTFLNDAQTLLLRAAYDLPALVVYDYHGTTHSLVAAYEIFDDAKRLKEIETRNPQYLPWAVGPKVVAGRA